MGKGAHAARQKHTETYDCCYSQGYSYNCTCSCTRLHTSTHRDQPWGGPRRTGDRGGGGEFVQTGLEYLGFPKQCSHLF